VRLAFEIIIVVCFWIMLIYCYRTLTKKKREREVVVAEAPSSDLREENTKPGVFKVDEEVERQEGINQTNGGFEMKENDIEK
jgi:hypothetical protein